MPNRANAELLTAGRCDVLVIGGGPGGATIAALLAERGRDVVLIEKARHPRFHIGESLLPLNLPLFERLGVDEEIKRVGMPKYGAGFVSPWHDHSVTFDFANAVDKSFPCSYQVRRSEFDHIRFRNVVRKGSTAALRDLFMSPGDSRLQEAVLSVPAGDIFRGTPLGLRLFTFKTIYYLINLFNPRRTLSAWKKRKQILGGPNAEMTAI